jgi:hypothetical protein
MARRRTRQQADEILPEEHGRAEAGEEESMETSANAGARRAEAAGQPAARRSGEETNGTADEAHAAVTAEQPVPGLAAEDGEASATDRAEEMIDQIASRVAHYTSVFGRALLRLGARAREEAEDIWAEAQNIRHGGQP